MAYFTQADVEAVDLRLAVTDDVVAEYPVTIRCREHNDKSRGNLAVYRDHLHCYGCGFHESKTMAALAYLLKVDLEEAVKVAPRYTGAAIDGYRERTAQETRRDPLPDSLATIYHGVLMKQRRHRLEWLKARGLSKATLETFSVGHDGMRYTIPVFDKDWRLVSMRYRRDDMYCAESSAKYLGMKGRNGRYLFSEPLLAHHKPEWAVVCEGEFDCMRLWQERIPAVTVTNGAGQLHTIPGLVRESFPSVHMLIIAGDMDEPGQAAAEQTTQVAKDLGFLTRRLTWTEGKDISEALQLGGLRAADIRKVAL